MALCTHLDSGAKLKSAGLTDVFGAVTLYGSVLGGGAGGLSASSVAVGRSVVMTSQRRKGGGARSEVKRVHGFFSSLL